MLCLFYVLLGRFCRQHWWPARTPDECAVGCVLAQNTRWERVVPVIESMRKTGLTDPAVICSTSTEVLAESLRGCGTHNRKARYLQSLCRVLVELGWNGRPDSLDRYETAYLRTRFLSVKGVGPETCDSLLLYLLGRPVFVVDAYTRRILNRHGFCSGATYEEIQELFHWALPQSVPLYNEYHALLVACGKTFCRPLPRCVECPVRHLSTPDLPETLGERIFGARGRFPSGHSQ